MKAFILAGGKGTRLGEQYKDIPKPLVKILNKPILEYQLELLKKYGITDITILIHYLGEQIVDYFQDGAKWGVKIKYFKENEPLGTAGGIKELEKGFTEDALVFYGDVMMNFDLARFINFHQKHQPLVSLIAHPNDHPFDSDLIEINEESKIVKILNKPHPQGLIYKNLVTAACYILSPKVCQYIEKGKAQDFAKNIFPKALEVGEPLYAYNTPEYFKDIGTPQRLEEVTEDIRSGIFELKNINHPRPAIFLDRDGVIIEDTKQKDFFTVELLTGAPQAIKKINKSKYLAIVITNQAAVAKGLCSLVDVDKANKKMETLLGQEGAKLDGIYFCPHLPEKGYPGENLAFKIDCQCRKPKIGMIEQAVKDFNINLAESYFIGDAAVDAQTAANAKVKFIGVATGDGCQDDKYKISINEICPNLEIAVDKIITNNK